MSSTVSRVVFLFSSTRISLIFSAATVPASRAITMGTRSRRSLTLRVSRPARARTTPERGKTRTMNPAEVATTLVIERTLQDSAAYRKVDESLYVIKQGSAYVMINVVPWGRDKAMVRVVAQLVKGCRMTGDLATQLLQLNSHLRFGAFAWDQQDNIVLFTHTILGGTTLDADELIATLSDVALIA